MTTTQTIRTWIPLFAVHIPQEVDKPLLEVLHSGYIGQGAKVEEFEQVLSRYLGTKNVVTVNNGTAALHLAYRLAGVEEQYDEVISTPMTCTATNVPILANHGTIVWADVDTKTGLIDPVDVERKITPRTKAITVVDWGGTPGPMRRLMEIGAKYNVKIIEDAAHALGAEYDKKRVGSIADFTCFSLQAIKHITTVDGGLLTCRNSDDYRRAKLLRWYGIDRETERKDSRIEEDIKEWGYKFHMNDIAATIGLVQMQYIDAILAKHRLNAAYYTKTLSDFYIKPQPEPTAVSSYWLYTIVLPSKEIRDNFIAYMTKNGVHASQVHARNDTHTTFFQYRRNLPGVTQFSERMVSIPVNWTLTEAEREKIVNLCNDFAKTNV